MLECLNIKNCKKKYIKSKKLKVGSLKISTNVTRFTMKNRLKTQLTKIINEDGDITTDYIQ